MGRPWFEAPVATLSPTKADILFERRVRPRLREVAAFFQVALRQEIAPEVRRTVTERFLHLVQADGRSAWEAAEDIFRSHRKDLEQTEPLPPPPAGAPGPVAVAAQTKG